MNNPQTVATSCSPTQAPSPHRQRIHIFFSLSLGRRGGAIRPVQDPPFSTVVDSHISPGSHPSLHRSANDVEPEKFFLVRLHWFSPPHGAFWQRRKAPQPREPTGATLLASISPGGRLRDLVWKFRCNPPVLQNNTVGSACTDACLFLYAEHHLSICAVPALLLTSTTNASLPQTPTQTASSALVTPHEFSPRAWQHHRHASSPPLPNLFDFTSNAVQRASPDRSSRDRTTRRGRPLKRHPAPTQATCAPTSRQLRRPATPAWGHTHPASVGAVSDEPRTQEGRRSPAPPAMPALAIFVPVRTHDRVARRDRARTRETASPRQNAAPPHAQASDEAFVYPPAARCVRPWGAAGEARTGPRCLERVAGTTAPCLWPALPGCSSPPKNLTATPPREPG